MSETFATPDDFGPPRASELQGGLFESLAAQAGEAFMGTSRGVSRLQQYTQAQGFPVVEGDTSAGFLDRPAFRDRADLQPPPEIAIDDARKRVKDEGLESQVKLPDQPTIKSGVLDLMLAHGHERADYDAAVARGPHNFAAGALGYVTSIGAGLVDPLNAAAFSVPVMGEARAGALIAGAGDSLLARAGIKAGIGAAQGAVGSAALVPADWWLHTQDGQDYTFADALRSVALGAGMGAVAHAGIGLYGDLGARLRGRPLPGSPEDLVARGLMGGTHVAAAALADEGVPIEQVPGTPGSPPGVPPHPAEVFADLPPAVREDLVHAGAADLIAGRDVRGGEMLQTGAEQDPRIAESTGDIEAFHGSPHDFDRFDIGKIGQGEGAQAYGHGLYLAEEEAVARRYSKTTSFRDFMRKVQELYGEFDHPDEAQEALAESEDFTPGQKRLLAALEKDDWLGFEYPHQAVAAAVKDPGAFDMSPETHAALRDLGNLYKVRIKADRDHMLDWDKPVAEQSAHVKAALAKVFGPMYPGQAGAPIEDVLGVHGQSGKEVYQHLIRQQPGTPGATSSAGMRLDEVGRVRPQQASKVLSDAGIRGIKYLDQGSRVVDGDPVRLRQEAEKWREIVAKREERAAAMPTSEAAQIDLADARAKLAELDHFIEHGVPQTRNFVVFDDKDIEITHKNGEPVTREEIAGQREPEQAAPPTPTLSPQERGEGAPAAVLRPDPEAWRKFADGRDPNLEPDAVAESRAAAATPEPASIDAAKAPSEAERLAGEADQLLKDIEPQLTDEEREAFREALDQVASDKTAREAIVRDGTACLMAAVA